MSPREQQRARYIEGWNSMDAETLLASVTEDFFYDDPTEPTRITREMLVAYMPVWPEKAAALGAAFEFDMLDKVVQDRNGLLTEWYWWQLCGTDVEGSAVIKTCDRGVMWEKLTYFRMPWPLLR